MYELFVHTIFYIINAMYIYIYVYEYEYVYKERER